ncbi:MAG: molybdopterin molybdotransferase MoeA [Candidatus Omnitrophica bacterium]|nr:molybdopterin molybdotransferase MoeA [Candidatus Omnitrophota bacterium]
MTQTYIATPRLTSVEEARRIVLEQAVMLGSERVRLEDGIGRVLAQDLIAEASLPPFDNSAMDGYAVRSSDTTGASREHPLTLRLVGEVAAGEVLERAVSRREAVKIMTGAPLPPGADSVVALEEARVRNGLVEILADVALGRHVRNAGEDIKAGDTALAAGTRIRVQHLGLLAGLGYAEVPVFRLPRVAVLATGSELISIDEPLGPGKIRNSNSLVLGAFLRQLGIEPVDLGTVVDERDLIRQQLEEAATCDVILISGGVSVGEHDLVKRVLRDLGMKTLFWRVNMKPGKPLLFGRLRNSVIFGLPGNPISCVVCFLEFIAPYVRKVTGEDDPTDGLVRARLTQPLRKKEPKTLLLTAQLREEAGTLAVTATPQQGSGMLKSLAQANAFIVVPEDIMELAAGSLVEVIPLGGDPWL